MLLISCEASDFPRLGRSIRVYLVTCRAPSLRSTFQAGDGCPEVGSSLLGLMVLPEAHPCLTLGGAEADVLVLADGLEPVECREPVCKSLPLLLNRATRDAPWLQSVIFIT